LYSWLVNGVNQTAVYGSSAIAVSLPPGEYNVTSIVYSSLNTLTYTWQYTVEPVTCTNLGSGYGILFRIALILAVFTFATLFMVIGEKANLDTIPAFALIAAGLVILITVLAPIITQYCAS